MANIFDQFDAVAEAPVTAPVQAGPNPFDQFDATPASLLGTVTVPVAELDAATARSGGQGLDRMFGADTGMADPALAYEKRKAELEAAEQLIRTRSEINTDLRADPLQLPAGNPLFDLAAQQRAAEARRTGIAVPAPAGEPTPEAMAETLRLQGEQQKPGEIQRGVENFDASLKARNKLVTTQPQTLSEGRNFAESTAAGVIGIGAGAVDAGLIAAAKLAGTPEAKARFDEAARDVQQWASTIARPDAAQTEEFSGKLGQGLGSTGGFFLAGAIGRGLGLGATATTAIAGALPQASQMYREAEAKGASETQKWLAFAAGLGIGASEALPVAQAMQRWDVQVPGFKQIIRSGILSSGEEGIQELGQGLAQNAAAKAIYDPTRSVTEGALENTAIGMLTGGGFGVAGSAATNLLRQEQAGEEALRDLPLPDMPDMPGSPASAVPGRPELPAGAVDAEGFIGADPEAPVPQPGRESTRDQLQGLLDDPRSADEIRADIAAQKDADERKADRFTAGLEAAGIAAPVGVDAAAAPLEAATPLQQAEQIVREAGKASTSLIQRRLGLGYNDAARLVEQLEAAGIVSAPDQTGKRTILTAPEEQTGERDSPIVIRGPEDVDRGAENFVIQPTKQDIDAGKTVKRHVDWNGLRIDIETERGEERTGADTNGGSWSVVMPAPYGEILRSKGADGDAIDVYLGPSDTNGIFVIDQVDPQTGRFDEHKVMLGYADEASALATYQQAFSDGSGKSRAGAVTPMTVAQFRQWVANGQAKKPIAYQPPIRAGLTSQQFSDLNRFIMEPGQSLDPVKLATKLDAPPDAVRTVMQKLAAAGTIDMTPAGQFRRPNKLEMLDILQFVASRGGVNPRAARELTDLDKVFLPRFGRVVRLNGLSWDELQEQAAEAGYQFRADGSGGMDTNELIEALRQTIAGQPVYARGDQTRALEKQEQQEQAERGDDDGGDAYRRDITAVAQQYDIRLSSQELDEIAKVMAGGGMSALDALEAWHDRAMYDMAADVIRRAQGRNDEELSQIPDGFEAADFGFGVRPQGRDERPGNVPVGQDEGTAAGQQLGQDRGGEIEEGVAQAFDTPGTQQTDDTFPGDRPAGSGASLNEWFKGSKILNDEGTGPLVVHHFTYNDFEQFDRQWAAKNLKRDPEGVDTIGSWFTDNPEARYVNPEWGGKRIDVYLRITNPLYLDDEAGDGKSDSFTQLQRMVKDAGGSTALRERLQSQGYDGIVFTGTQLDGVRQNAMIAFEPNQIRRAPTAAKKQPTAEAGADGKPQLVIPGAERIGQGEQAQRGADAALKPKAPQKDAGGLFGDDAASPQLFDAPPPAAKPAPAAQPPGAFRAGDEEITEANGIKVGDTVTVEGRTIGKAVVEQMWNRQLIAGRDTAMATVRAPDGKAIAVNATLLRAAPAPAGPQKVGDNRFGDPVFEDANGKRSYVSNGITLEQGDGELTDAFRTREEAQTQRVADTAGTLPERIERWKSQDKTWAEVLDLLGRDIATDELRQAAKLWNAKGEKKAPGFPVSNEAPGRADQPKSAGLAKIKAKREAKATEPAEGDKRLGFNDDAFPLFEDKRGVRYYVKGGVKIFEKVRMVPQRGGGMGISTDHKREPEFERVPQRGDFIDEVKAEIERRKGESDEAYYGRINDTYWPLAGTPKGNEFFDQARTALEPLTDFSYVTLVKRKSDGIRGAGIALRETPIGWTWGADYSSGNSGAGSTALELERRERIFPTRDAAGQAAGARMIQGLQNSVPASELKALREAIDREFPPGPPTKAGKAVADSRETAAGRLPVEDDRERQRQENVAASAMDIPDGVTVETASLTSKEDTKRGMPKWTAVARRDTPFSSERGYGDTAQEARADALRRLDAGKAGKAGNSPAAVSGASNTVFTADKAAAARARLKAKLSGSQLNSGIDPETIQDGITLAGFHIEAGARKWADYTRVMLGDLGEAVRPYLRGWYEAVRYYPGFDAQGMSTAAEIEAADSAPASTEKAETTTAPAESSTLALGGKAGAIERFRERGAKAFAEGKPRRVPVEVIEAGAKAADAWSNGWDRANLAEPVPGVTDTPEWQNGRTPASKAKTGESTMVEDIADAFRIAFSEGKGFQTILQARKHAEKVTREPIKPGTEMAKIADEAIELGVVMRARDIVDEGRRDGRSSGAVYDQLVKLYEMQPNLSVRTSTSMRDQAYSTPVPLAYLASRLANIGPASTVYEPTAGNGALLIEANPVNTVTNELNPERRAALELQGFKPLALDASDAGTKSKAFSQNKGSRFDVVIENPPFGVVRDDDGKSRTFKVNERYSTNEIDHAIVMSSLITMKDDGRAVLIIGGVNKLMKTREARSDAYNGKAKREFFQTLYGEYNVVDHFTVDGDLYAKQGAGYPVDVIVINGRGRSARKVPAVDVPRIIASWADLRSQLDVAKTTGPALGEADRPAVGSRPAGAAAGAAADSGRVGGGRADTGGVRGPAAGAPQPAVGGASDRGGERPVDRPAQLQPQSGNGQGAAGADAAGVQRRPTVAEQAQASLFEDDTAAETQPALDAPAQPKPRQAPAASTPAAVDMSKPQVPYRPRSDANGMGTLVPVNMQTSAQEALNDLERQVGNIDEYVTRELGYSSVADMKRYLAAEQVDGVALGIFNFTKNAGLIIGDQTGIGKGRQVASILRWAIKNGKTPIFVTEKPNLYADMYRDLTDIGINEMLGRPIKMFMTNAGESVPLDEEGKNVLRSQQAGPHQIAMRRMAQSGDLEGHDIIFTTYSQMQTVKGEQTERMAFLRAMASKNGVIVVDEAHNAGGSATAREKTNEKGEVIISRASFVREVLALADAALYSSATYAKRPDVMDLYFKTDMALAVDDISKLGDLITRGGIPMQQITAAMLSRAGQYVRRERSFEGIVYDTPVVDVDTDKYEEFSRDIALIQQFSENFVSKAVKNLDERLKEDGRQVSNDGSTGGAGASSTNFTAVMHNIINQLLLSMKAQAAADRAIAALKRGEKPVITLANTNEAFIDEYAEQVGAKVGDAIGIRFNDVLQRYLDRSRTITVKKPFAKKGEKGERIYLTDDDLGPAGVAAYNEAKRAIAAADFTGLSVSPIDWIRAQVIRAGFTVSEITGRGLTLDYRADGQSVLKMRPGTEKSITGRRAAISGFNSGKIDVLIINQSGSTGLSLHASEKVLNKNKRVMILAQAEGNIDTHMQMLGRVNRTGQVVLPDYQQLVAGIPAEKRPASILAKKMASLNANTTGARDSAVTAKDTPDFMNAYGDRVAAMVMTENPDINRRLGEPISIGEEGDTIDGAMRKVTGRIPLLPLKEQEELYDLLQAEYEALIRQLEASGQNALEAKTLELDARTEETATVKPGKGTSSPFADAVYFEKVDAKRLGKPMSPAQVIDTLVSKIGLGDRTEIDNKTTDEAKLAILAALGRGVTKGKIADAVREFTAYKKTALEAVKKDDQRRQMQVKLDDVQTRWNAVMDKVAPGQGVVLKTNEGNFYGIVTDVTFSGRAKNPLALSAWRVDIALADPARTMNVPFSQLYTARTQPEKGGDFLIEIDTANSIGSMSLLRAFEDMQAERREQRIVVTGNILAGFDFVNGSGQIVNFTDNEGRLRQGILMRRGFDAEKFLSKKAVILKSGRAVLTYLQRVKKTIVQSTDKFVAIRESNSGDVMITTDSTRQGGGRYFLNRKITDAANKDFVKVGSQMRMEVYPTRAVEVIDKLIEAGATFEAADNIDVAREIAGKDDRAFSLRVFTNKPKTPTKNNVEFDKIDRITADIDRLEGSLRRRLDKLGLADVGIRLVKELRFNFEGDSFPASGMYLRGLITVALDGENQQILDHEALHALKRLGAFTEQEWRILSNRSKADWMGRWNIAQGYAAFPEWAQVEEGVAHAYEAWAKGRYKVAGPLARIFQRIRNILEALRNGLTGLGFKSVEGIFLDVERGVVGARAQRDRGDASVPSNDGELFRKSMMQTMERPTGGDAAFALKRDPETVAERQKVMQGFIARGQPLDRAIRIPFSWIGGIDGEGRWNWGRWASDTSSNIVSNAKFDPNGRMAWLNGPLEIARAGWLDRHGQDPEYVQRERKRSNDERAILMQGVEVLKTLAEAKIGVTEAKVLQAILTGEPVTDADMEKLAEPIRVAIDEMGQEAVALGLLSPESYQRNRGAYLTRAYQRYEQEKNGLVKLTDRIMGSRRKKIIGDQFKGRGMFVDVDVARLLRDDPEFRTAERGKPVKGERFKVFQYITEAVDIDGVVTEKPTRRVYWPADRALPSKLAGPGWREEGTWEVRGVSGDKITIWRDYTKEERSKMGEILDARYTIGKTYLTMAHDLATGRFYKDIAENEEWTQTVEPKGKWVDGAKARQLWIDPEVQWVKVPMTAIGNSGGKLQWGALAGRYVRAEIWRDINELQTMQTPNFWRTLLTQWKLNKTARSPVTHMNNIMSNFIFADLADIRLQDIKAGIQSYMNKDQNYREALENGAFGGDMMSVEVRDKVLKPLLDEIEAQGAAANTAAGKARFFGKMADLIWSSWKTFDGAMLDAYRVEDELFRMATYMRRRQLGDTAADAASFAREQFLDYDIRAPWVRLARNTVLPFISYTYRAAPLIARAIAHRPWKLAKYFAITYALNALSYALDDDDEEEKERGSLREDEQGRSWIGVPLMMRAPFRDKDGMPVFLDVRRWIPAGDIFDTGRGSAAIDIPAPLMLGGPLMLGAELFMNKQAFTGKEITNKLTDGWMDKGWKVGDWAFKAWMPNAPWVPNSYSNNRIMNAWRGATEADGRAYSMPLALTAAVGIKLKPQDVEQGYYWQFNDLRKAERALKAEARAFGRQLERNIISQSTYDRSVAAIVEKMGELAKRGEKLAEKQGGGSAGSDDDDD